MKISTKFAALAAVLLAVICAPSMALAQATYQTAAGNVRVNGNVPLTCNASGANCQVATPASTSVNRLLSAAATTNSTLVKASAGLVFRVDGRNNKASPVYLKLYDKASAPTCGTDVPVYTIYIAATSSYSFEFNAKPFSFGTGIGYCLTGAAADNDTTVLVAADVVTMNVLFQ